MVLSAPATALRLTADAGAPTRCVFPQERETGKPKKEKKERKEKEKQTKGNIFFKRKVSTTNLRIA